MISLESIKEDSKCHGLVHLREKDLTKSKQIGASFRRGRQLADLAGIDVFTIPPKVAHEFKDLHPDYHKIADKTGMNYAPGLNADLDIEKIIERSASLAPRMVRAMVSAAW